MKLSNERLVNSVSGLSKIATKNLPVKVSYAIAKNIAKIESIIAIYDKERQKLIDKYSVKDSEGKTVVGENNQITIQNEFLDNWNSDINELKAIENEIDIHKFSIADLTGEMMPSELMLIDYMIKD